jgi:hypothetical protein
MSKGQHIHVKTADDVRNSICGISHKRYIFELPDDFSCKILACDTEYDQDICYEMFFNESAAKGVYDISRFPGNAFSGHIGKAIFTKWTKMICEGGAEFIFLLPPKGDALALCLGLMSRLLEPGGYITHDNVEDRAECHIQLPRPVGYSIGKLGRLNAEGEILRWTCHVEYGIEPIWGEISSAITSSLSGEKIIPLFGNFPVPNPFIMGKFVHKMNIDLSDSDFMDELRAETMKFAVEKFIDKAPGGDVDEFMLPKLLRRLENWLRGEKIREWLAIPGEAMRDVSNAKTSFIGESDITMLGMEDKSGWPAAFSIKFGKGRLSVYPQCVDIGTVISLDECSLRGVRYEDEEKSTVASDEYIKETPPNAVVTLPEIADTILESKRIDVSAPAFTLKVSYSYNKIEAIDAKVSGAVFLKFLVIWYASMTEDGIAFLPGSLKRFDNMKAKMRESGYDLAMMKLKGKKEVNSLPCGSLFYEGNPANIQSDYVMDTICKVLFNVRSITETSSTGGSSKATEIFELRKRVLEAILGRKFDDKKAAGVGKIPVKINDGSPLGFSCEKLNGVRVIIKKSLFNKLSKLTLGDKIRGNAKFNKDKDVFFKKLARFIEQK